MRKIKQADRPYTILYIRGLRRLLDSATTLEAAKARCDGRLAKPHNRGEAAVVSFQGRIVYTAGAA